MPNEPPKRLLEHLTTCILTFDAELRLTSMNPAGEMLFEVSAKKVVGQRLTDLLPQSFRYARALREALATQHPFTAREVRLPLPGQRTVTVDCTVTPFTEAGRPSALLVELNQVDRWLRMTRDEDRLDRQSANRAVMRGLAHEIKNPLGGLRGAAQLLERALPDKALKEYTHIIIHEADRLRNLVDRLIGPSKPMNREPVNIHRVLEHVRRLVLVEVPVGLTIERAYDPSLPEFTGDPEQLIQAILNIVRNAAEATGGRGIIHLRTRVEHHATLVHRRPQLVVCAEIEDNGPGIPGDIREHLFYPMITSKPGGAGLGLSIAQDIVAKHGGLIECRSRPGQTVFTLYLPLETARG